MTLFGLLQIEPITSLASWNGVLRFYRQLSTSDFHSMLGKETGWMSDGARDSMTELGIFKGITLSNFSISMQVKIDGSRRKISRWSDRKAIDLNVAIIAQRFVDQ
jgi:hypothetical protein